jgi:ubiquinone/menaquinone biosynthesis C-methylase UbiE
VNREHGVGHHALVAREQSFFDTKNERYTIIRRRITRTIGAFDRSDEMHGFYDPTGRRVLDYGCGGGRFTLELLERGATTVTGIDVSETRVEAARQRVVAAGLSDRADLLVADAHNTGLPAHSFDLVIGSDILHHLELRPAAVEIARLVAPGGAAVFIEPLAHNPLLRLGRRLTPSARTTDEHPLSEHDWELLAEIFPSFRHEERELLTIPLMPLNLLLPRLWQERLGSRAAPIDDRLLQSFPKARRYARRTILVMAH